MGNGGILDVGLIRGVVHDDRVVRQGVVDPFLELLLAEGRSGRVIWIAKVDDVDAAAGQARDEVVLGRAGDIDDIAPTVVDQCARTSAHDVRVDIDRIDRIGDADTVVVPEDVTDVAAIALGAIADKDLARLDRDAPAGIVVFYNRVY